MGSGATRTYRSSFKGTAALQSVEVGFKPRSVEIFNLTTAGSLKWIDPMPDASAIKTVTAGAQTYVTTGGITPTATGFTLGTDAVNSSGGLIVYEATE